MACHHKMIQKHKKEGERKNRLAKHKARLGKRNGKGINDRVLRQATTINVNHFNAK